MVIAAGLVVALSALVQGAVGYGMALVAAPLLALVDPTLVPVPLILLTSGHAVLAVVRDGRHADWPGIGWAMLGRLPGTGLGVLAVVALSQRVFSLLVGLSVLACVVLSLLTWRPRPRPGSLLVAGLVSGAGGTAASIGGPPIALLYQDAAGPRDPWHDRWLFRPGLGNLDRRTHRCGSGHGRVVGEYRSAHALC